MINRIYLPAKLAIKIDGSRYLKVDRDLIQKYFEEVMLKDPEVEVEISITRVDGKKSNQQLRYFYSVVLPIIKNGLEDLQGESLTKEEVIMFLKDKYFYEEVPINNEFVKLPMSLSKATKEEVSKFISNVINFGNDILGINIPEPIKPTAQ